MTTSANGFALANFVLQRKARSDSRSQIKLLVLVIFMKNYSTSRLLLLASSLLFSVGAQPTFAMTGATKIKAAPTNQLKPQRLTSRLSLANLLLKHQTNRFRYSMVDYVLAEDMPMPISPVADLGAKNADSNAGTTTPQFNTSETNVQVQGVDESDIIKVAKDGYIYQISNNKVRVIKGFPVIEMAQRADIPLPQENFSPTGLYVENGRLIVTGSTWQYLDAPVQSESGATAKIAVDYRYDGYCWWGCGYSQTRALVYDVSSPENPKLVRDVSIDGDYVDSRRIGDNLYFVTRSYPRYYLYGNELKPADIKPADMLPAITETKQGKTTTRLMSISQVSYLPEFVEPDYVIVTGLNLTSDSRSVTTKAYLGAGEMVYSSMNNLYLSASKYNFGGDYYYDESQKNNVTTTQIFKFGIGNGSVTFSAAGEVEGTVLNQFSMDEHGDYFRIATTTHNWYDGADQSSNSLFVLNKEMQTVGKLENLAKGERIYSTRFMGNRAYIVTFKQVDPLFAIDLTTPENPFVAGELKIPGYSEYLHPYDENHLIGIGHDAITYNNGYGEVSIPLGLKMALFDVTDMKNPKELYNVKIGGRGTSSPLTYNHKALYWDAEKHLFGFPVDYYETPADAKPDAYGVGKWQGAYIYEVTPAGGFVEKAKLSQLPISTHVTINYGEYSPFYAQNYFVERILRVENSLFTLSQNQLNAYDLNSFAEQNRVALKQ